MTSGKDFPSRVPAVEALTQPPPPVLAWVGMAVIRQDVSFLLVVGPWHSPGVCGWRGVLGEGLGTLASGWL